MLSTLMLAFTLVLQPMYGLAAGQVANAVASYPVSAGFTQSEIDTNWSKDRTVPSGGHSSVAAFAGVSNVLEMSLDKDRASTSAFYQTEGLKKQNGTSTAIKVDLYVDGDWTSNSKTVRAGLWGTGKNAVGAVTAYPIVEFTTDGHTGWRSYNTLTGAWNNSAAAYNLNGWNTLEITLDTSTDTINYLVNGVSIGSAAANGSTTFADTILNTKNYGPTAQSYDVRYANYVSGVFVPEPQITSVDAYYTAKTDYTAISVDFKTENITNANKIELRVNRDDLSTYSITAKDNVINSMNTTSPFVTTGPIVIDGSRISSSWNNQEGTWSGAALPESVDVIITLANSRVLTLTDVTIGTNFATWDQVKPAPVRPVISSVTPSEGSFISGKTQRIDVNVADVDAVRAGNLQLNKVVTEGQSPANGAREVYTLQKDAAGWYAVVNTTVLENGAKYLFKVEAHGFGTPHGYYGNNSAWQYASYYFEVDNTGPVVSVQSPASGSLVKGVQKFVVNANDQSGMTKVHMYLQQDGFTRTYNMTDIGSGQWEYEVDTTTLNGDGQYFVVVRAVDALGNVRHFNNRHNGHFVTVDNTVPTATLVASSSNPTTEDSVTITGSVAEDDIKSHWFEITTPNGVYYEYNMGTTDKEFDFVLDTSAGAGEYRVRYVATDRAGNRNDSVAPAVLVLNVTAPAAMDKEDDDDVVGEEESTNDGTGGESIDEQPEQQTAQIFTTPVGIFGNQPIFIGQGAPANENEADQAETPNGNSDVLGEQDQEKGTPLTDTGEVLGIMDHKLFGIAWYWYLVILGAIIGAWLMLAASIRRGREEV